MDNNAIRVGIVGCGRVAENHVAAIAKCPNVKLAAASGGRKAAEFAQRHGITLLKQEEICESGILDALLVLTPVGTHHEYTMRALKAGKHVLVEKPVSFNIEEIRDMICLAKERNLICMPGHSYLYLPELTRVAKTVSSGGIGLPVYLYMSETYYMPPELLAKYEGPEIDVLCHHLYLSLAFLGKPEKVSAFRTCFPRDIVPTGGPQITVNLRYPDGTLAQILISWAVEDPTSDPWTFKVKILGAQGGMHFSRLDHMKKIDGNWEQMSYQEMFDQQMNYFINRCILNGEAPLSSIEDAEKVCLMQTIVLQAAREEKVLSFSFG
jgi:predicted dehydrogenase